MSSLNEIFLSPVSRSAFGHWWIEQNGAVLHKVATRWLPACMRQALHAFQNRYATPTVVIDPDRRILTLLPRSPEDAPHSVPATPEGMAEIASRCAASRSRARLPRKERPVSVRVVIPGLPILQRVIRIPATARAESVHFVGYEMERIVPLPSSEILWGLSPLPSEHPAEAEFLLSVAPLARLTPWLEVLKAAHLTPVTFANRPESDAASLAVTDHGMNAHASNKLLISIVLAAGMCLAAPFLWQSLTEYRLNSRLETLQPSRLVAETLRNRIEALTSGSNLLSREAQRIGSPLHLLASLTEALPDNTFLESLSVKQGQVTLEGQSGEAARLIGLLEHKNAVRDPKFVGPLLRLPDARGESFTLHATVPNSGP